MSEVIKKASFKPLPIELNFQALACQGQLGLAIGNILSEFAFGKIYNCEYAARIIVVKIKINFMEIIFSMPSEKENHLENGTP